MVLKVSFPPQDCENTLVVIKGVAVAILSLSL